LPNPFRGLTPFEEKDRHELFERDVDVEAIVGHLWSSRVCLLFAGSGVGKTSFLRAKLVPHLKSILGRQCVFSPEKWAQQEPVASLRNLEPDPGYAPDQSESSESEIQDEQETDNNQKTQILILDQFEEVFQYFPNAILLNKLGKELAALVSPMSRGKSSESEAGSASYKQLKSHDTRIIISIREEFLAELSTFDSFLPNLLSNYYRLERLTIRQAQSIIEKTANIDKVATDKEKLSWLLDDLRTVQETRKLGAFIDPPYLQIVCKQLWDNAPPQDSAFLSNYERGVAEQTLKHYCDGHLDSLTWREKVVINRAIGFMTTGKYQAKKSMRLREIQDRIGRGRLDILAAALNKLSAEGVKIFRRWEEQEPIPRVAEQDEGSRPNPQIPEREKEPRRPEVYALYHDMYAPMLWNWRERQERVERGKTTAISAVGLALLFFFVLWPLWKYWSVQAALSDPEYGKAAQFASVLEFRNDLAQTVIWRPLADSIWRRYTERLASLAALKLDTDGALLYRLAGVAVTGRKANDADVSATIASKRYLLGTFSVEKDTQVVDATLVKDVDVTWPQDQNKIHKEGDTIVAVTRSGRILRWPLKSGDQSGKQIVVDFGATFGNGTGLPAGPLPSSQRDSDALIVLAVSPPVMGEGRTVKALVGWIYRDPLHPSVRTIRVAEVSTETLSVSSPLSLPMDASANGDRGPNCKILAGPKNKASSKSPATAPPHDFVASQAFDPLLKRVNELKGFYSPDGKTFAIVDGGIARTPNKDRTEFTALPGTQIAKVAFSDDDNRVIAVSDKAAGFDLERVSFIINHEGSWKRVEAAEAGCDRDAFVYRSGVPAEGGRLFFVKGQGVMEIVNAVWCLVSPDSGVALAATPPGPVTAFPYALRKEGEGSLTVWTDLEGVIGYAVLALDTPATPAGAMSSDPHAKAGTTPRIMTVASLASFEAPDAKLLTIDEGGRVVRAWRVPAPEPPLRSNKMPPPPGPLPSKSLLDEAAGSPLDRSMTTFAASRSKSAFVRVSGTQVTVTGPHSWSKAVEVSKGGVVVSLAVNDQGSIVTMRTREGRQEKTFLIPENYPIEVADEGRASFNADEQYAVIACVRWVRVFGLRGWLPVISLGDKSAGGETTVTNVSLSAKGTRVLVWIGADVLYVDADGPLTITNKGGVLDAVFGPGRESHIGF
jgi:hypothetical protein